MAVRAKRVAVRDKPRDSQPPEDPPGPSRRWPARTILIFVAVSVLSAGVAVAAVLTRQPLTVVTVAGNLPMLDDAGMKAAIEEEGLDVRQTPFGTRKPQDIDLTRYDLVVSGSEVQSKLVAAQLPGAAKRSWFSSPMVVVTREPLTALLQQAAVARPLPGGAWEFDVAAYLDQVKAGRRWVDIRDAAAVYPSPVAMLVSTTDPQLSNSAAMFVAIVSYLANDNDVVKDDEDVREVIEQVRLCFEPQGDMPTRTPDLMDKFLSGDLPMALVYENDFLAAKHPGVVAMYPTVNVASDNILISRTEAGKKLARLLIDKGPIRERARADWGYTDAASAGRPPIVASVPVPKHEILEGLIDGL